MHDDANPYEAPKAPVGVAVHQAPEGDEVVLASRGIRLLAVILDGIASSVVSFPILGLLGYFDGVFEGRQPSFGMQLVGLAISLASFMAVHGYFLATNAQSLFKKVFRLQIVTQDGRPASFGRIVGRRLLPLWAIAWIPFLGGLVGLVDCLLIFRSNRRCLHDELANTMVIQLP